MNKEKDCLTCYWHYKNNDSGKACHDNEESPVYPNHIPCLKDDLKHYAPIPFPSKMDLLALDSMRNKIPVFYWNGFDWKTAPVLRICLNGYVVDKSDHKGHIPDKIYRAKPIPEDITEEYGNEYLEKNKLYFWNDDSEDFKTGTLSAFEKGCDHPYRCYEAFFKHCSKDKPA